MTPLVLLPGMMCDARLFKHQVEYFSSTREVLVLPITEQPSVSRLADDILNCAPDKFALAGLSMGGIVAMDIMAKAPERVERLALLDTNPLAEPEQTTRNRLLQIQQVEAGKLADVMRDEMKPLYLVEGPERQGHLDLCMDMAMTLGASVFIRQSKALSSRVDQTETLRGIEVPTLVLCGKHDVLCPVSRHEYMHQKIASSRLRVIDDAGHLPTLENARETNHALADWLRG